MSMLRRGRQLGLLTGVLVVVSLICQVEMLAKVYFCMRSIKGTTPYPLFVRFAISMVPPASNGGVVIEMPFVLAPDAFHLNAIPPNSNVVWIMLESACAVSLYNSHDIRTLVTVTQQLVFHETLQSENFIVDDGLEAQRFGWWQAESVS